MMNSATTKKIVWAVFLSLAFMYILLHRVDWADFRAIGDRLVIKNLLIAFVAILSSNLIRSYRFLILDHVSNKYTPWFIMNNIYNFLTATLPGGVGEAATVYLLRRYLFFDMLSALRILLISRIMDVSALSMLLLVVAIQASGNIFYSEMAIWFSCIVLLLSLIAIVPVTEHFVLRQMQKLPGKNRIMKKTREKLNELIEISEEYQSRSAFTITIVQSVMMFTLTALSLHYMLLSFKSDFTIFQSFYCYLLYTFFQMIPIQGFAGVGTQPARWLIALNAAGYNGSDAVALSIAIHGAFYLFLTILALSALAIWQVRRRTFLNKV